MKREYIQKIKNKKALVSVVSILLILSFILEISITTPLAISRSCQAATTEQTDTATDQANGLEYQTISSFPGKDKTEIVTLDGLMPVNAEVSVQSSDEYSGDNLFAYDISITDQNGKEFQPESNDPIKVEITNKMIVNTRKTDRKPRLWHIDDNGLREEITNFDIENDKIIFEASGFSVYEVDDGTPPLRTYKFLMPGDPHNNSDYTAYYFPTGSQNDQNGYKEICSQTIKNGEKLIFPQLPADIDSKYTFVGWFVGSGGTPGDQKLDFNNVPAVTQTETIELYACFDSCVYAIFHEQYNGRTETFPVFATRRGSLVHNEIDHDLEAEFTFDDLKVIYDDDEKVEGAPPSMQFVGWTTEPIQDYTTGITTTVLPSPYTFSIAEDSDDKSIRLYPVFEPIRWLEFDSNGSGATYIPPESFPKNEGVVFDNSVPVRTGYTFLGWYTEKDEGTQVTDSAQNLISTLNTPTLAVRNGKLFVKDPYLEVKLYAHWAPSNSKYTVIIWKQKEADDRYATEKTYDFAESETFDNVLTEQSVSVSNTYKTKNYAGFYYARCDNAKTVVGNGSTVLNVYYDRCKVIYRFFSSKNNSTPSDTWRGLYGQLISKYGYTWESNSAWYYKKGTGNMGITYLESFNSIDTNYSNYNSSSYTYTTDIYRSGSNSNRQVIHVLQDLNGNYDLNNTDLVHYTKVSSDASSFEFTNKFEGFTVYGYSQEAFTANPTNNAIDSNEPDETGKVKSVQLNNKDLYVYHKRRSHTLKFVDSVSEQEYGSEDVLYQAPLSDHRPSDPTAPPTEGYSFTNWYSNEACSSNAVIDFNNMIMPNANMIIYAGWETIWYKIEIDPNGGELSSTQSTFFWEPYNGDPIEEYINVSRDYEADVNGTHYYAKHDRQYWGLGDEWEPREDDITDRGAFYTTDIGKASDETRYREATGAYRYLGWFEVDPDTGNETPYLFGEPVMHDTYLRLHWKQLGTYFIKYDAGEGTLDLADQNEKTFEFLDADDYADHADVVVTRVAQPIDGKNFIGWRIKNDPSEKVYYPGQSFLFGSEYAEAISQVNEETGEVEIKRTIILEAVYEEIKTARIIYDANGGTITDPGSAVLPVNAGGQVINDAPPPVNDPDYYDRLTVKYSVSETQLTVSDLLNNSAVKLSNGTGFSNNGYAFLGWSPNRDGTGVFYDKESITTTNRWVDNNEPLILYAQWEVKVYFDRNDLKYPAYTYYWGDGRGDDWSADSMYAYDAVKGMYYTTVKLNGKVDRPVYTPTSSDPEEIFSNWSFNRQDAAGVMRPAFDFASTDITQALINSQHNEGNYLILHACWKAPIRIPVYYVVTSDEEWVRNDSWRKDGDGANIVLRDSSHVSLASKTAADSYAKDDVTDGYEYAFAAESGKNDDDYKTITDNAQIKEIWYDSEEMCVKVKYSDNTVNEFDAANDAVYLVYYKSPEFIPVGYDLMAINGSLTAVPVSAAAPIQANVVLETPYDMTARLTAPVSWAGNAYNYYSFAVGKEDAAGAADLMFITGYKTSDDDRPELKVRNNWNGFEYSTDGTNWHNCGYGIELYVVYYEQLPTIVNLREETIALPDRMGTEFEYQITVTQTEKQVTTRIFATRSGYHNHYVYTPITDDDRYSPVVTEGTPTTHTVTPGIPDLTLSNGQSDSYVLFYSTPTTSEGEWKQYNNHYYNYQQVYYKDTKVNQITQTITITQTANNNFTTSNDAVGGDQEYNSNYTSSSSADPVTITYTNRQNLEKTVNVAVSAGDELTARNNLRTTDTSIYQHDFTNSNDWNISDTTVVSPSSLIDNNSDYVFLGIITGSEDNGSVTKGQTGITQLSFGEIAPETYGYYLNGDTSQPLGDREIWFVYAKKPKIKYLYEKPNGEFEPITSFTRNGSTFARPEIAQNETVPVGDDGLLIDQITTPGSPAFLIPGDLDHQNDPLKLDLNRVSIGNSSGITEESDSESLRITITDEQLQYSFHDTDTPQTFAEDAVIYAVYKIKGYELTLIKHVFGDSAGVNTFTFEISSDQLIYSTYDTSAGQLTATENTITLTVQRGESVTVYGLLSGVYTIKETTAGIHEMTAKINGTDAIVTANSIAASITGNTIVEVSDTFPIPVTGFGEKATPCIVVAAVILMAAVLVFICRKKGGRQNELSSL